MKASHHRIDVSQLKEAIDPIAFYTDEGQDVATKGASPWKIAGLCPFHADRNQGSFYINDTNGAYSCFSCETSGGDIVDFIQKKYSVSFEDAIRKLARQRGVV